MIPCDHAVETSQFIARNAAARPGPSVRILHMVLSPLALCLRSSHSRPARAGAGEYAVIAHRSTWPLPVILLTPGRWAIPRQSSRRLDAAAARSLSKIPGIPADSPVAG